MQNGQKEMGKVSDELNSHVVKVKWAQNKLKQELENHKVCLELRDLAIVLLECIIWT